MSGRKGKAVAQRSNSNRMKHDNTPSSHSTAAKPNVEPTISTSTEDTKQFLVPQDRTGLTLNSLSYLSQDALLFSCFNLTLLHFYCQMYLLYRQEYQYWNWRQVSLSAAGLLNVYAAISPDKKKESLSTMLKAIWKAEHRVQAVSSRIWAIVESDEVNFFFSAALVVTMFFVTVDHSLNDVTNPFIAANWIVSVVLLSLKTRDARWINRLVQQTLTLAWPEPSFAFVLETLWVFGYTCTSGVFFATIAPRLTAYSTVGTLAIPAWDLTVVTCSLALALPAVLLMYLIQAHRCQLYLHVRQLHRFYSEQHAPALPWRDRLVGTVVRVLHRWLCHEIHSLTRWNGDRPTVTVAWALGWLSLYVLTGVACIVGRCGGQELYCSLALLAGALVPMALVVVCRPRYVVDTTVRLVKRRPLNPTTTTATTTTTTAAANVPATAVASSSHGGLAVDEASPEDGNSPAASPDGHAKPPPSQRMAALFALDHDHDHNGAAPAATATATAAAAAAAAAPAPTWPSLYSVEHLEGQLQSIKAFHSSLLETFTYQQLQSSVQRKARSPSASMAMAAGSATSATAASATAAAATAGAALASSTTAGGGSGGGSGSGGGGAGIDLTTSFSQLSLASMVGGIASSLTAVQPSTGSVSSASATAMATAVGDAAAPGDGSTQATTAEAPSWLGQLDHVVDASEAAGSVSSVAAAAWVLQQSVLQGVTADTPLPTVTIASPSLLRPPSHHPNGAKTIASASSTTTTATAATTATTSNDTAPTTTTGSRSHHHRKTRGAHQNSSGHAANKLSIDVSSAMVGGSGSGGGAANGPSSLTTSSPPHPATPPAVTILSITHHHGAAAAASVSSTSAAAASASASASAASSSSSSVAQQPSPSQPPPHHHPPAPGLSLQRKSKSLDRPSSFATSSPTAASASASSHAEFPSPGSATAASVANANRSQHHHRSARQGHHQSSAAATASSAAVTAAPAVGPSSSSSSSSLPRR